MSQRIDHADLVARALGHLDGPERERVDAAVAADPALAAELDHVAQHLLLYDALPDAPDAPPFEALAPRVADEPQGDGIEVADLPRPAPVEASRRWIGVAALAAATLLLGFLVIDRITEQTPQADLRVDARLGAGIEVLRDGSALVRVPVGGEQSLELQPGDVLRADRPAEVTLAERVQVVLDGGAPLVIDGPERVRLRRGRARFDVAPGAFTVATDAGDVEVVGTAFEVDLRFDEPAVLVFEGTVRFRGETIEAGHGLSGIDLAPLAPRSGWRLEPRVELLARSQRVRLGAPLELDLAFVNDGYATVRAEGVRGVLVPLRVEIWRVDENGVRMGDSRSLAVHSENIVRGGNLLEPGQAVILGARERRTLSVRLRSPFPTSGSYRLRAWYGDDEKGPRIPSANLLEIEVSE